MKKLGGYFCFKKTRIDGKTKGEHLEVSRKMRTFACNNVKTLSA